MFFTKLDPVLYPSGLLLPLLKSRLVFILFVSPCTPLYTMFSSDVIEIKDEPLAFYKGDFTGILVLYDAY